MYEIFAFLQMQHIALSYEPGIENNITSLCVFQSCKEQVDACVFLFSFTDRASFEDLPNQMSKWAGKPSEKVVKLVVGTKYPYIQSVLQNLFLTAYAKSQNKYIPACDLYIDGMQCNMKNVQLWSMTGHQLTLYHFIDICP